MQRKSYVKIMKIAKTTAELTQLLSQLNTSDSVGFVPTMGALHAGHISLVERCKKENDTVVVSIFVNPTQFNDKNDLTNYPRTEEADAALLESAGCDIVFLPTVEQIYPEPDTRVFDFGQLEKVMEGPLRPGHFNGVAQVVSTLFALVKPTRAYFGEKDFQQLAIIRKMVKDYNIGVEIVGCEIVRDSDGLALSSRNVLLTSEQREASPVIYMTISRAQKVAESLGIELAKKWVKEQIECCKGFEIDYFEVVDSFTLQSLENMSDSSNRRACIAVKVGNIRLIDNIEF